MAQTVYQFSVAPRTMPAHSSAEPKNSGMKADDTITLLIDCMAATALVAGIFANDFITNAEKAKYTPAIKPQLIAATHRAIV